MRSKDKKGSWRVSLGVYLFIPRFHSHLFWASQQTQKPQNISRGFQNQVTLDATPRKGYTRLYEHPASAPGPGPGEALLGAKDRASPSVSGCSLFGNTGAALQWSSRPLPAQLCMETRLYIAEVRG